MEIVSILPKRHFNVVLDIYNTSSWKGRQFDATFTLDLKRIVQDPRDLARPYRITFSYYMMGGAFATSTLSQTSLYALHIDFRRNNNIQLLDKPQPYAGTLQFITVANAATPTLGYLAAYPTDNHSIYLDNLTNLTEVEIATIVNSTGAVFNAADNSGINAITKYAVYLHFEAL
jgi:hypothetical protein